MQEEIKKDIQDLTWLSWSKIRNSSGTAGSFLKSYSDLGGKKIYYKLSNYDIVKGIVGHECVNELIVDRLLTILGVEHLHYQLIHGSIFLPGKQCTTWLCASQDFKERGESKVALDAFYEAEHLKDETPLNFCIRNGWASCIWQMLVVDYLILNRDRHGANIEVLRNAKKKTLRLAPLFDHGLSLIFNCQNEEDVSHFDVLQDKPVQCFVASHSTWQNLQQIPVDAMPSLIPLREQDRDILFAGLEETIGQVWLNKIWEMLWKRWCAYENFCNQRRNG